MSITMSARKARTFTRAALLSAVVSNVLTGVVSLVVAIVGSRYLIPTFDLSPTLVHVTIVAVFLPFLAATAMDLYRFWTLPSVIAGMGEELGMIPSAASAPAPANPTAIRDFEQRMVDIARPFAWARAISDVILGAALVALTVVAFRHSGPLVSSKMPLYLFGAMFVLAVVGGVVSDIYRTYAAYWIPLSQKTNVVVKPIELLLLVTWLGFIVVFDSLFVMSGSPQLIAVAVLVGVIAAALMINNYRQTVSRTLVNPIDLTPITIDAGEQIAISVVGLSIAGAGLLQKVAFGRKVPQQFFTPQSGRKLDSWGQNAFLVSEMRMYFIYVPVGLGDQMQGVSALESLLGGEQIRAKLDEMLRTMTLRQIYDSSPINFAIDLADLARVEVIRTIIRQIIRFVDRNGDKISAGIKPSPELDEFEAYAQRTGITLSVVNP